MTTTYNFTLRPYGDAPDRGIVAIDGAAALPRRVITALREAGIEVDSDFE